MHATSSGKKGQRVTAAFKNVLREGRRSPNIRSDKGQGFRFQAEKKTSITCTSIIPKSKSIMPASDKNNEVLTVWKHHIQTVVSLC